MFASLERLEPRLMLHSSPVLDAEHLAVFGSMDATTHVVTGGLVPDSAVTDTAVASGSWEDPKTWSTGAVPAANDNVLIPFNTVVTLHQVDTVAALRTVRVDGTIAFDPTVNTGLLVDTIIVEPIGTFQMGTSSQPIQAGVRSRVIFADRGDIDLNWDPLQFSRGLVSHGDVSIYGSEVTSFVNYSGNLAHGTTQISLPSLPTGWSVGDRLVITGDTATNAQGVNQDEEVQIAAIKGTTITISSPTVPGWKGLKYDHLAPADYISDVTRNATFESQNVDVIARRGHMMFMHNEDVHISGVGFYGLGRTDKRNPIDDPVLVADLDNPGKMTTDVITSYVNVQHPELGHRVLSPVVDANGNPVKNTNGAYKYQDANGNALQIARTGLNPRGRYAVHFHRTGVTDDGDAATISDSAVVDSPGWGIVNHSSNVDVTGNVVFNAVGAAYVTEAGDEIGSFDGNIAIHSLGASGGVESRQNVQDFGFQGDGFWLQGGNVSLTNNVVTGQRGSGYVFFPRGLVQKGLGTTQIPAADLANPAWANGQALVDVGNVPLRKFQNNVAFASGDGFESWFSLLNVSGKFADQRNVLQNFQVGLTNGTGIFTPYTAYTTFQNVTVVGNDARPSGTAFARNDVTHDLVYDHVHTEGFTTGIDVPVNGTNVINAGTFNNLRDIFISTANSRNRTVDIHDDPTDLTSGQIQFVNNLKTTKGLPVTQYDVYLQSNFNPKENDITRLFNPDVIRMGTVTFNGVQLYFNEQAANFIPFNGDPNAGPLAASYVPAQFIGKTNQQLFDTYGLAIGGVVAPADATTDPRVNGLIGKPATYLPDLQLLSPKYYNFDNSPYKLAYRYYDPSALKHDSSGYVTVRETTPTVLSNGWNVVTRTILGTTRTLLVFGDNIPPTFQFSQGIPTTINRSDIDNGTALLIQGFIVDNSFGKKDFKATFNLNDPAHVTTIKTRDDGSLYVTLSFTVSDNAGNKYLASIDLTVTDTAPLIKDITRKNLPTIMPSITLQALIGHA